MCPGELTLDLSLTSAGHLVLSEFTSDETGVCATLDESTQSSLRTAFGRGPAELLLCLTTLPQESKLPPAFAFWRTLGERYLTALCHIPEPAEDLKQPIAAPFDKLKEMVDAAPPMRGGEYLRAETLAGLWKMLDMEVRRDISTEPGGIGEWLRKRSPAWHRVGRVCFHLAENKRDTECPFAFLATYAPKLADGGRVQYQPLGRALEEYAGAKNRKLLVHLLSPVQRAAESCAWVKELVDSGRVFHPLRWTPPEAHRLLRDVPRLEENGLLVRVPNWWTKRPQRVRVGISIGNKAVSKFSADAMLDFRVDTTLDGQRLTQKEWESILRGADGLVFLKGQWVEVDREKLRETLQHWKRVKKAVGEDGLSFLQGMRLLAGAPIDAESTQLLDGQDPAWAEVHAGDWLARTLQQLREPQNTEVQVPPPDLHATLRPYQETGVKWLWLLTRLGLGACLADDMGLGKTIQVLSLLLMLKRQRSSEKRRPSLLVMPASLLANWKAEIVKFSPSLRCLFVHPSQVRPADLNTAGKNPGRALADMDVVLTTYSTLARQEWLASVAWSLVVLDEAQAIKNPTTRQTRIVKQLKGDARIVLTGTPIENRLTDLWSIFDFLCPGLLGSIKTFGGFVNRLEQRAADQYGPLRKLVAPMQ
ncbi:MAG: hypothetical protein IPK83_11105 [Planctomycetes bacterium]|nr:hypothetical protein [Planctomycetota bacterium]